MCQVPRDPSEALKRFRVSSAEYERRRHVLPQKQIKDTKGLDLGDVKWRYVGERWRRG